MTATPQETALAIGPANYAGQATAWARALTEHAQIPAWSFTRSGGDGAFGHPADRASGGPERRRLLRVGGTLDEALAGATHVALDGFITVTGLPRLRRIERDLALLERRGLTTALIAHGSDVRDIDAHLARNRHSYFREASAGYLRRMRRFSGRNRQAATHAGVPVFVSTPDLLHDLPFARWLPVCTDLSRWAAAGTAPVLERQRPVVLHLPTRTDPPTKGTVHVDPVLARLADEGLVEYRRPGKVAYADMPSVIGSADIVIDQIMGDAYGVASVEAMAAGRVVIAGVHGTRALMPEDPPLVDAAPDTLETVLRGIVAERDAYRARAEAGRDFAARWHDGRESARVLQGFCDGTDPGLRSTSAS